MLKVSRKVEYALLALKALNAMTGQRVSARELSDKFAMPFDVTSRVLQLMAHKNYVVAEHGVHGGYSLAVRLSSVSFLELVETILGATHLVDCLHDDDEIQCERSANCQISAPLAKLDSKWRIFLTSISLAELLSEDFDNEFVV